MPLTSALEDCLKLNGHYNREYSTGAADCMRQYVGDVLEFLADFHTLTKIKVILYSRYYKLLCYQQNIIQCYFRVIARVHLLA